MTVEGKSLLYLLLAISGVLLSLSGCASTIGVSVPQVQNTSPVYGPPQIIYRIDDDRYFTLENYTRCENGKTFYNNKSKGIHTQIAPSSGYLFKGRLFWLSTRDDRLSFPITRNDNKAACMGSDKGCVNVIGFTVNGGETYRSVTYGGYTQDPNGDTSKYDLLVMNDSSYLIHYRGADRICPVVYRWDFDENNKSGVIRSDHEYELFKPDEQVPVGGFYKIDLSKFYPKNGVLTMHCDRTLEPVQL